MEMESKLEPWQKTNVQLATLAAQNSTSGFNARTALWLGSKEEENEQGFGKIAEVATKAFLARAPLIRDDAEDLCHDFVLKHFQFGSFQKALEVRYAKNVRLRAFLWTSLKHFLIDHLRRARLSSGLPSRSKPHGKDEGKMQAADFETVLPEAVEQENVEFDFQAVEAVFNREWALQVLEHAKAQLSAGFEEEQREVMERLLAALNGSGEKLVDIARAFGLKNEDVKAKNNRMRKKLAEAVTEQIRLRMPGATEEEVGEERKRLSEWVK